MGLGPLLLPDKTAPYAARVKGGIRGGAGIHGGPRAGSTQKQANDVFDADPVEGLVHPGSGQGPAKGRGFQGQAG